MSFCVFSGGEVYQNHFEAGIYVCARCGYELFSSKTKYAHSSPWPAFTETLHLDSVSKHEERALWEVRQRSGPRIPQRRPEEGPVSLLNIQQLPQVRP
ncbi:methionine-R-sulfoxide reductase B1 isoform X2 [Heteronotia binoei]|uniref:methionine-R-sulfoxide reductase B1 isoform X2 n=1 Tax=Heteronotia binoei TaxID=13085 RepID=UPI00292EBC2B|nr:methionine-R-sulfoxide reductase B1 isoform X2 [Heteronotia binoei]